MRRDITPVLFANTLRYALDYRTAGMSQIEAVRQACHTAGISDVWAFILQAVLNDSPSVAEDWAERARDEALDTMATKMESFR